MTSCWTRISDVTACMAGTPSHRWPHCRAASSIGSNGSAIRSGPSVHDSWTAQPGPLHDPLDGQVPLVGPADVADIAEPLLLGGGLEHEVPEAEHAAMQGLDDRD